MLDGVSYLFVIPDYHSRHRGKQQGSSLRAAVGRRGLFCRWCWYVRCCLGRGLLNRIRLGLNYLRLGCGYRGAADRVDVNTEKLVVDEYIEGAHCSGLCRRALFFLNQFPGECFFNDSVPLFNVFKRYRFHTFRDRSNTILPLKEFLSVTGNWA